MIVEYISIQVMLNYPYTSTGVGSEPDVSGLVPGLVAGGAPGGTPVAVVVVVLVVLVELVVVDVVVLEDGGAGVVF
jgi:hypothetical protein